MAQCFDSAYVDRLRDHDAETEQHFVSYFSDLITIKLRSRLRSQSLAEDIRQETFVRVLRTLRSPDGIKHPERLGAFVNSVCNNVMLEALRAQSRHPTAPEHSAESVCTSASPPDESLVTEERKAQVRGIVDHLPARDRKVLRAIFLEEKERDEVCAQMGVARDYLRVLLHRAKSEFRKDFMRRQASREPGF
ncbi:MAG: sigma-70 family RNA polymerase sigma factor [Acidobacteriota bacterium]